MRMAVKKILKALEYVNLRALWVSMAALFLLMLMTSVNAVIRKAGIGGIADSLDLTQLLMVLVIFCAFAFQESKKEHIRVDMFVSKLPGGASAIMETVLNILSTGILALFAYAYFDNISGSYRQGAATQVWRIPEWPFTLAVAAALSLFALTAFFNAIDALISGGRTGNR